jgi:hypothetical protein
MAHAGGRPTKYQEKLCCQIARLGVRAGLTELQIAGEIGVSEDTINEWKKVHPEFSEALKSARLPLLEQIEKSHYRSALGFRYKAQKPMTKFVGDGVQEIEIVEYQEYQPPNVTAQIHILKKQMKEKYGEEPGNDAADKKLTIEFD